MEIKSKRKVCMILYIIIFAATAAPVFCGYVMDGGAAPIWLARIGEIKNGLMDGTLCWFPTASFVTAHNWEANAFDSALWLLLPAGLQILGIEEQMAYCIFMGLIQVGTMAAAVWMMKTIFQESETVLFGALFYMTCPYRLYICYDKADLGQALVWALVPALIGGFTGIHQNKGRSVLGWCMAIAAYAGIWYADARLAVLIGGGAIVYFLLWERWLLCLVPVFVGALFAMPAVIYLMRYVIKGGMQIWNLPLGSIMGKGYTPGFFLTTWVYRPDVPGMGIGYMAILLLLVWLYWNGYAAQMHKSAMGLLIAAGILTVFSLKYVPWDYVQRLGTPFMRYIGLLESAGVFWGFANMFFAVPAAWAVVEVRKRPDNLSRWGIPVAILAAALGTAFYICNSLTYLRVPLGQIPVSGVMY